MKEVIDSAHRKHGSHVCSQLIFFMHPSNDTRTTEAKGYNESDGYTY